MKKKPQQDLIPGIFNYCDGWCKRCRFKDRCAIGGIGEWDLEYEGAEGEFRHLSGIVQSVDVSVKVLGDASIEVNPEDEEAYEKRQFEIKRMVRQHEITKLAKKYRQTMRRFFEKRVIEQIREKIEEFDGMKNLGTISPEKVAETMLKLGDSLEKVEWYYLLIEMKIQVALETRLGEHEWDDDRDAAEAGGEMNLQAHYDGVCKVVLLSIDKSIAAWKHVREVLAGTEPDAVNALASLEELKNKIISEFPDAMKFRRPGFDEEVFQASLN